MLAQFTSWFLGVVSQWFSDLWVFVSDIFVHLVGMLANALAGLVALIPIPGFLSGGLQSLYSQLDPGMAWICSEVGLPAALGVIGAGYLFRLARKAATLFQW